jgi:hypothetical protein
MCKPTDSVDGALLLNGVEQLVDAFVDLRIGLNLDRDEFLRCFTGGRRVCGSAPAGRLPCMRNAAHALDS